MIIDLMVPIPGGTILLRDDRKKSSWNIQLSPFLLSKYPVTQELYFATTKKAPSTFTGNNRPVETVSWLEAVSFCNQLSTQTGFEQCYSIVNDSAFRHSDKKGYRLPTEAEWEFACRAGMHNVRYGELDNISWFKDNSLQTTHDVGTKEPNRWGLYDMLGNVWEWCWDLYDEEVYGSYRVLRGGGFADPERGCLASNRRRSHPTFKIDDLGFRIARSI